MFKKLKPFKQILVTGPQRSGTTICARMIADDLGLAFYPEERVGINNPNRLAELLLTESDFVLQCPGLSHVVHKFAHKRIAVVWMKRSLADIKKSEQRINWQDFVERRNYMADDNPKHIAQIKNELWRATQKHIIDNAFEINFDSLERYPLFVPEAVRETFGPRQIEI